MKLHTHSSSIVLPCSEFVAQFSIGLRALIGLCTLVLLAGNAGCNSSTSVNLAGPLVINSFVATPTAITAGQSTTLAWSVTVAALNLTISDGSGSQAASGLTALTGNTVSVTPTATTTYTLTATDAHGNSTTATAQVTVVPLPSISSFKATPSIIANGSGQSTKLSWTVSGVAGGVTRIACGTPGCGFTNSNYGTPVATDPNTGMGSISVNPTATTQYTLYAINAAGVQDVLPGTFAYAYATVTVVPTPSILSFTATPAIIGPPSNGQNQCSTLNWIVSGATTSVTISDNVDSNVSAVNSTGSTQVCISKSTTYTLTATDLVNSFPATTSESAKVTVTQNPPPSIYSFNSSAPSIPAGGHVSLTPVFTPTDATASISQCTGTVADCSSSTGTFETIGTASSGVPFDTNALSVGSTFMLTVTNSAGNAKATKRVLAGDIAHVAGQVGLPGYMDGAALSARFDLPNGIAADSSGNLFVADTLNNVIRKVAPDGTVSTYAGNPGVPGSGLPGISGSRDGPASCAGGQKCGEFNSPQGVAVDDAGNVYVADYANYTIRMITPLNSANPLQVITIAGVPTQAGAQSLTPIPAQQALFGGPVALTFDSISGNLYVVDQQNQSIIAISAPGSPASTVSVLAGPGAPDQLGCKDGLGTAANFDYPSGIAVDRRNGNMYVADNSNNIIRKITPQGSVATFAGACDPSRYAASGAPGSADGTGPAASFNSPSGVAVDQVGNVYVTDSLNYTIRALTPTPDGSQGIVTTIVGQVDEQDKTLAGGPLPGLIVYPSQIDVDSTKGNLFFTTYTNPGAQEDAILSVPY